MDNMECNTVQRLENKDEFLYNTIYENAKNIDIKIQYESYNNIVKRFPVVGSVSSYADAKTDKFDLSHLINIELMENIIKNEKDIDKSKFNIKFTDYNEKYDPIKLTEENKQIIFDLVKFYINSKQNSNDFFNRIGSILTKGTSITGNLFDHYDKAFNPYFGNEDCEKERIGITLFHKGAYTRGLSFVIIFKH